jgi:shikimate dehydrogenase
MDYLDVIDPLAQKVGSVNTLLHENGRLFGCSTDGPGTLRAFAEAKVSIEGKRVLFMGAGGAVRAVAFAVADAGPESITVLGRTQSRLDALVADLKKKTAANIRSGLIVEDVEREAPDADVIIQGTPAGMYPDAMESTVVRSGLLKPGQVVFDMVYRPMKTRLLREAEAAGCTVISGTEMLLYQAALQFELWTGLPAPVEAMREALLGNVRAG